LAVAFGSVPLARFLSYRASQLRSRSDSLSPESPALISSTAKITDRERYVSDTQEGDGVNAAVPQRPISVYKVFSATRAQDREVLGERVSAWLAANPHLEVRQTVVSLSSDSRFHCLSFVLICSDRAGAA
jgi:hypothetical protein